jgi:hypothetical protein
LAWVHNNEPPGFGLRLESVIGRVQQSKYARGFSKVAIGPPTRDTVTGRGVLSKVHVVPEAPFNLFSISPPMEHGWTLGGSKEAGIWLQKDSFTLRFDIRLDTPEGVVLCACLKLVISENGYVGTSVKQLSIQKGHHCLSHMGEVNTRAVSDGKSHAVVLPVVKIVLLARDDKRISLVGGAIANPRAYLDCCTLPMTDSNLSPKPGGSLLCTQAISDIFPSQNSMVEPTAVILNKMEQQGRGLKYLRMDNAGETKALSQRLKSHDWKLPFTVEFTARDAPQQNSPVEVASSTLSGRVRAMMSHANVPKHLKHRNEGRRSDCYPMELNAEMSSDIFTKIVGGADFVKHREVYVREKTVGR